MKKFVPEFIRRGMIAAGIGPIVLAVLYLVMKYRAGIDTLSVYEAVTGIFSLTALAFIAGGMNVIYQIEKLPLMAAILIHGSVLYASYLITYLVNDWLESGAVPILVFTGIFIVGYFLIWAVIYFIMKKRTARLNELLKRKNEDIEKNNFA